MERYTITNTTQIHDMDNNRIICDASSPDEAADIARRMNFALEVSVSNTQQRRDMIAACAMSTWIEVLAKRHSAGNMDAELCHEAARLAVIAADAMIKKLGSTAQC